MVISESVSTDGYENYIYDATLRSSLFYTLKAHLFLSSLTHPRYIQNCCWENIFTLWSSLQFVYIFRVIYIFIPLYDYTEYTCPTLLPVFSASLKRSFSTYTRIHLLHFTNNNIILTVIIIITPRTKKENKKYQNKKTKWSRHTIPAHKYNMASVT